jgi:glycosyltransferase involved in cell wall biosynthesis
MRTDQHAAPTAREPGIFIDVTDLLTWKGRHTGIQRVTRDIVTAFLALHPVRLLHFAGSAIGYVEVSVEFYHSALNENGATQRPWPLLWWLRSPRVVNLMPDFQLGDRVLLTGGGWANREPLRALGRLRERRGIKIHRFIHDVMPITEPQFFHPDEIAQFTRYTADALSIADSVLTSSAWNADQLRALFEQGQLPRRPLAVVGLGDNSLIDLDPVPPAMPITAGGFVLVVGSLDVRKNQRVIYQAYQIALSQGHAPPTLVLVGPHGRMWQEAVHLIHRDIRLRDRVIVATDVSDRELAWLYRHCAYTIYPSLCEGWGLPIGESLAFGKVCLSSNRAAMPEVGGHFAHRFDPHNPLELRNLMVRLANHDYLDAEETRIRASFVPRTWKDVAVAMRAAIGVNAMADSASA